MVAVHDRGDILPQRALPNVGVPAVLQVDEEAVGQDTLVHGLRVRPRAHELPGAPVRDRPHGHYHMLKELFDVRVKSADDLVARFNYPVLGTVPEIYVSYDDSSSEDEETDD